MFGRKTYIKQKLLYPDFLFPKEKSFPEFPASGTRISARLSAIVQKFKYWDHISRVERQQATHTSGGKVLALPV